MKPHDAVALVPEPSPPPPRMATLMLTRRLTLAFAFAAALTSGCRCGGGVGDDCTTDADCRDDLVCGPDGTCQDPSGTDASFPPCEGCMTCPPPTGCPAMCDICATDAGPDAGGTDAAATDAGPDDFSISIANINITGNCKPIAPPDPWIIAFDATYTNDGPTAATAIITSATMTLSSPGTPALDLTMSPADSGSVAPLGGTVVVTHMKTSSTPDIPDDCNHCGDTATLVVTYDVGGVPLVVPAPSQPVMCAL